MVFVSPSAVRRAKSEDTRSSTDWSVRNCGLARLLTSVAVYWLARAHDPRRLVAPIRLGHGGREGDVGERRAPVLGLWRDRRVWRLWGEVEIPGLGVVGLEARDELVGVCPHHVCRVTLPHGRRAVDVERHVVVAARERRPLVPVRRVLRQGPVVPILADDGRGVPRAAQGRFDRARLVVGLLLIRRPVGQHAVVVGVQPRPDGATRRTAQGRRGVGMGELGALLIEQRQGLGHRDHRALQALVIREDDDDVRWISDQRLARTPGCLARTHRAPWGRPHREYEHEQSSTNRSYPRGEHGWSPSDRRQQLRFRS